MISKTSQTFEASERKLGLAFLLPSSIFLVIFLFAPIIYSIYMSLFGWRLFDLGRQKEFVGFANFLRMFSDELFINAATNTLLLVTVCLFFEMVLGFLIALTLWNIQRSLKIVHSIILLPMITSPVIVALIWRYLFDPQFGFLNYILKIAFGITGMAWLGDVSTALMSIMIVDIWQMTSFVILILYAGMTTIPTECVESAFVDGASYGKMVHHIILPFMFPTIFLVMILRTMDLLKIFETIFVLTRGGPGAATESFSTYIYKTGFVFFDMGYATSLSIVTFAFILLVSIGYLKARSTGNMRE